MQVTAIFFSTIIGIIILTYIYFLVGHATYADELKKRIEEMQEAERDDYENIDDDENEQVHNHAAFYFIIYFCHLIRVLLRKALQVRATRSSMPSASRSKHIHWILSYD